MNTILAFDLHSLKAARIAGASSVRLVPLAAIVQTYSLLFSFAAAPIA